MLRLTTDQMMNSDMSDAQFVAWYVDEFMPEELADFYIDLGPETCKRFVANGRKYAAHFGITRPDLQGQFLTLMWELGPSFFEVREFRGWLDKKAMPQAEKVDALYNVSHASAEEALATANHEYWYPEMIRDNVLGVPFDDGSEDVLDG